MRAEAGAGDGHADAEGEGAQRQYPGYGSDMGVGRQSPGCRLRQPRAEHRIGAEQADGQCHHDPQQAARVAPLEEVARDTVEAEARALQQHAKRPAEQHRQRQGATQRILVGQQQGQREEEGSDRERRRYAHAGAGEGLLVTAKSTGVERARQSERARGCPRARLSTGIG